MLIELLAHVVALATFLQTVSDDAPNVQARTFDVLRNAGPSTAPSGSRFVTP